jgi:antitoxin component HigA of HigAB toxin-antitoxin module
LLREWRTRSLFHPGARSGSTTRLRWSIGWPNCAQTPDQLEFLDLVSDLLGEYERQFLKIDDSSDPFELLQYLVEENGISARELGKILNVDHSVAARILKGERGITVEHAKNLGARFKVDPKVFLKL